ncbi:DUF2059 domain-containing protein [Pseudosulfitobacter pseudonitzschiae]|uniref:DUF2059 domain-containing protein n=1 Tax=Pseudosulfitobacter pseudonitzschiae TaxID=1402135 RepID=UPI001AF91175|nr:DUF2059 domain-containing protein [Pseudosulfitobacter pseudonitzschiae]MBM1814750.1 DUF2059 domain-containing protein [Pseudosulfitobacter pseudonitzschiae]MBM1831744.1 DUF2059 domain-containing protein [Pseudosulfitobacter pseudonitzschiae]MBM1836609.1 DUF2059 domain-containing protein [Pseudosulfitobacter pseudonitzschiae]MBM1841456.1 DUF2059 domain-containing protein [Pseudosulfitobacter pseudonitzschiae]MBM1846323.1 DUF2059 domain-containing protein [Pseudosulfitobacter pseudonitzschia
MLRLIAAVWLGLAGVAWAGPEADTTLRLIHMDAQMQIAREEGLSHAETLNAEILGGQGGALWHSQLDGIYDVPRMVEGARGPIEALDTATLERLNLFLGSELGQRISDLELAARTAMMDQEKEDAARGAYAELQGTDDPRLKAARTIIEAGDLVERNVSTALTANYQFYRALVDGGAYIMTEEEILNEVWSQEEELRADTEAWLMGYLMLLMQPLDADERATYVAFMQTPEAGRLNAALFDGMGSVYSDVTYALGRVLALNLRALGESAQEL